MKVCNECKRSLQTEVYMAYHISFGYNSKYFDGEPDVDLCSERCFIKWATTNILPHFKEQIEALETHL